MTYDPKFSVKQMYDQYGRSRNTTKTAGPKGFTKKNTSKPSKSVSLGGFEPDPAQRSSRGLGSKPDYSSSAYDSGSDNNPNKDEYESKGLVAKLYDRAVTTLRNFGADEPEDVIVDGQRVYQGPLFRGYTPDTSNLFVDNNPNRDIRAVMPDSTMNIFGVNTDNPRLNMFGVERKSFRNPDPFIPPVLPESPANMDPMTRTLSQAMIPQAPPVMVDYEVGSFRDTENLMTIVEDLNRDGVDITLEELAKANDLPVNPDGSPVDPFVQKGEVIKVPVQGGVTPPREFMDNETKAMLQETTPIKANYITESLSSLTGKLSKATKDLVNSYTTSTTRGLGTKDTSTYKVERGDTMYAIAKRQGVTLDTLIEANPDVDADRIDVGQVINIPRGAELNELPPDVQAEVATAINNGEIKTKKDLTLKLYDAATFTGIPPIRQGENLINYFARSGLIGADEADPKFAKSFKGWGSGIDPSKTPWCADLLGSLILKSGGSIPSRAMEYRPASQNYEFLGETIYNHNPTTGKTYSGKPSDVKAGDILVFNNRLDGTRQSNGDFKYPNKAKGKGHVTVVLEVRDDGSIVAIGGNQSANAISYATGRKSTGGLRASVYTPEIMRQHYKGGFKINRLTDASLTQADPEIVAAIIKDAGLGGDGR